MNTILNFAGIFIVLGLMYLFSTDKKNVRFNLIGRVLLVQIVLAVLLIQFPYGRLLVKSIADCVMLVLSFGQKGLDFMFGSLAHPAGAAGYVFIVQGLGNIIFMAALIGGLHYLGIIGFIVQRLGRLIGKLTKTSEIENIVAVANMFLGLIESPLLIRKYIKYMTKSELTVVMTSGMGSMSATILGGYVALGISMEYLLIACAMVPLSSIIIAKILLPEEPGKGTQISGLTIDHKGNNKNILEAITNGAMDGAQLIIAIAASLIAIIGLVALINGMLSVVGLQLEQIFAVLFSPIAFFMGIDSANILFAGQLLGTKLTLNEFVAYDQLGKILAELDYRTGLILTVSLSGFANFSSMGINISSFSVLCPEKKSEIAQLVFRSMIGGFFVSVFNAMIVSFILSF